MSDDEFKFPTGLKDDYDGTITEAWFGTNAQYRQGMGMCLQLRKVADDGEEVVDLYPLPDDWASFDGGDTVEHPTAKNFSANSNVAKLVAAAFAAGAEEEIRARSEKLERRGARDSRIWVGLSFHWNVHSETFNLKDKDTGEDKKVTSSRVLPTKFLGVELVEGKEATQSSNTATSSPASSDNPLDSVEATTAAKIKVLAKAHPYHEWVDEVMGLPGVVDSNTLMAALGDEGFYNDLRG